ncbi:sensor histidine kinase [Microterricola gilva]|nr:HAMP domain-containing sensor histidine kinase [Microterricola gilva]
MTAAFAGFLVLAGATLLLVAFAVLRFVPDEAVQRSGDGGFAPNRSDLIEVLAPTAGYAMLFFVVIGVAGGWLLSGRLLRPLDRIHAGVRAVAAGDLTHRIALRGAPTEYVELAEAFDGMLDRVEHTVDSQRRFASNASHELRTPIAVIRTMLEVAAQDPDGTDYDELVRRLEITNRRSQNLVDALLQLARIEAGPRTAGRVELAAIVLQATDAVHGEAEASAVTISTTVEPCVLGGDAVLLTQLIVNLLQNGIRHNRASDARVLLSVESTASGVAVIVENTGQGVDPHIIPTLTEPFVRGSSRISSGTAGTGLGLALVATIAAAHGARLLVEPSQLGGLRVRVDFVTRH